MTIADYLKQKLRVLNIGKWVGIVAVVVGIFAMVVLHVPQGERRWFGVGAMLVMSAWFYIYTSRYVRCPKCNAPLQPANLKMNGALVAFCPKCGVSFSEPYQPNPIT